MEIHEGEEAIRGTVAHHNRLRALLGMPVTAPVVRQVSASDPEPQKAKRRIGRNPVRNPVRDPIGSQP